MKVKLVTDSTSCLTKEFLEKENISYLESVLMIDDVGHKELTEIDRKNFLPSLKHLDPYPTTSLASPQDALDIFEQAIEEGYEDILYVGISPNISNQYNSAKIAAKKMKDKANIHLYQSGLMGSSQGIMVYSAWKLQQKGKSMEEIVKYLDSIKENVYTIGISPGFDSLFKTGKIKKGVGITVIASVLQLKPIFEINLDQGVVGIGGGVGNRGALKKLIKNIEEKTDANITYDLLLSNAFAPDMQKKAKKEIQKVRDIKNIIYGEIPPVIAWAIGNKSIKVALAPTID